MFPIMSLSELMDILNRPRPKYVPVRIPPWAQPPEEPKRSLRVRLITWLVGFDPYKVQAKLDVALATGTEAGKNGLALYMDTETMAEEIAFLRKQLGDGAKFQTDYVTMDEHLKLIKQLKKTEEMLASSRNLFNSLLDDYDRNIIKMIPTGKKTADRNARM